MALHTKEDDDTPLELNPLYAQQAEESNAPRHALPRHELDPDVAYQLVPRYLADRLVSDLQRHAAYFDKLTSPLPDAAGASFSH